MKMGERSFSVHVLGTSRTDKKHGFFRALLRTRKQNCGKRNRRETSEDAGSRFTIYHRHHRHRVGHRRQRTNVRTGSALGRNPGRFHTLLIVPRMGAVATMRIVVIIVHGRIVISTFPVVLLLLRLHRSVSNLALPQNECDLRLPFDIVDIRRY